MAVNARSGEVAKTDALAVDALNGCLLAIIACWNVSVTLGTEISSMDKTSNSGTIADGNLLGSFVADNGHMPV